MEAVSTVPRCYRVKVPVCALLPPDTGWNSDRQAKETPEFTCPCSWFYLQGQEEEQAFTPARAVHFCGASQSSKMSVATAILGR